MSEHRLIGDIINLLFPCIVGLFTFAFLGAILFLDMSRHTLILLTATLHGVALGLIMIGLFGAMSVHSKP